MFAWIIQKQPRTIWVFCTIKSVWHRWKNSFSCRLRCKSKPATISHGLPACLLFFFLAPCQRTFSWNNLQLRCGNVLVVFTTLVLSCKTARIKKKGGREKMGLAAFFLLLSSFVFLEWNWVMEQQGIHFFCILCKLIQQQKAQYVRKVPRRGQQYQSNR